jgi:hypothetical protein
MRRRLSATARPPARVDEPGEPVQCLTCHGTGRTPSGRRCSSCAASGTIRAPLCLCGCGVACKLANRSGAKFRPYASNLCAMRALAPQRARARKMRRAARMYEAIAAPIVTRWRTHDGHLFDEEQDRSIERLVITLTRRIVDTVEERAYRSGHTTGARGFRAILEGGGDHGARQ